MKQKKCYQPFAPGPGGLDWANQPVPALSDLLEYALALSAWKQIMDRVFRDPDGTLWIVDYKTSHHQGADLEAFLDRERERYAPQPRAYVAATERARAGTFH